MRSYSLALDAVDQALRLIVSVPKRDRAKATEVVKKLQRSITERRNAFVQKRAREVKVDAAQEAERQERARRVHIRKQTNFYASMLSSDILMLICEHGTRMDPDFVQKMGRVCSFWRRSIYTQPHLWSQLVLGRKRPVDKAKFWRERSRGRIRRLVFDPRFDTTRTYDVLRAMEDEDEVNGLDQIPPHLRHLEICADVDVRRWKGKCSCLETLRNDARDGGPFEPIDRGLCPEGSTTLQALQLSYDYYTTPQPRPPSGTGMEADAEDSSDSEDEDAVPAPWSALKRLKMTDCHLNTHDGMRGPFFRHLGNLEDIELVRCVGYTTAPGVLSDEVEPYSGKVVLPNLRRYLDDQVGFAIIFGSQFCAPNLSELSLYNYGGRTMAELAGPGLDLSKLVSLDIGKSVLDDVAFSNLAKSMTSLRFLNVSASGLTDAFLQAISHVDLMDDTTLPRLEALSIAQTTITTRGIRDFVDSRLPPERRMAKLRAPAPAKKTTSGAFRPTKRSAPAASNSERPAVKLESVPSSASVRTTNALTADLDLSLFSTQPGEAFTRPSISWLCLDHCEAVSPDVVPLLQKHVAYVSWWCGTPMEERQRGRGRWRWDAGIESCVDEASQQCHMRMMGGV